MTTLDGHRVLGARVDVPAGEMEAAEAGLVRPLPPTYSDVLRRFGLGTFHETSWLVRPAHLQTWGSRIDAAPERGNCLVLAETDDGEAWGWDPASGSSRIRRLDRDAPPLEDLDAWIARSRHDFVAAGGRQPYFVPDGPMKLASDIAMLSPGMSVRSAHDALAPDRAETLVRADTETGSISAFYLAEARAILTIQSVHAELTRAATDSTLRVRWLDAGAVERTGPALDALWRAGWELDRARAPTFVWRDPRGRQLAVALLAGMGLTTL